MRTDRAVVGRKGEEEACRHLTRLGHRILARNWRGGHLELDIVTLQGNELHFVEVKSRVAPVMAEPQRNVGREKQRRLVAAARDAGLSVTFHRAFDETADPLAALEDVIALGCDRLLTSGHAPDAFTGRAMIGELVRRAGGRIVVMAGCGVRPGNIAQIAQDSGAPEFHSSCIENWL